MIHENYAAELGNSPFRPTKDMIAGRGALGVGGILLIIIMLAQAIGLVSQLRWFYGLLALSFILTAMAIAVRSKGYMAIKRRPELYFFAWLALLSTLWSISPVDTLYRSSLLFAFCWIYALTLFVSYTEGLRWTRYLFALVPIVFACISMVLLFEYGGLRASSELSASASVIASFSNWAPAFSELCVPFVYAFLLMEERSYRFKLLCYLALISWLFVVVVSNSRGAYIMAGIEIVFLPFILSRKVSNVPTRILAMLAVVAVVGMVSVALIGPSKTIGTIAARFESTQITDVFEEANSVKAKNLNAREAMYEAGLAAIKHDGLIGIGYGSLKTLANQKYGMPIVSHNFVITAWGELGLAGLVIFMIWIGRLYLGIKRLRDKVRSTDSELFYLSSAALVAIVIAMFHGLFRPLFTNSIFYVVCGLAVYLPMLYNRQRYSAEKNVERHFCADYKPGVSGLR